MWTSINQMKHLSSHKNPGLVAHICPWSWSPKIGWQVEPFVVDLEIELGGFDA
jgi:hypothetical protein